MQRLWPWVRALAYIIITSALIGASAAAFHLVAPRLHGRLSGFSALMVGETAACALALGVALLARRFVDHRTVGSLGLSFRTKWAQLLTLGAAFGAGMQCAVFAIDLLLGYSHVAAQTSPRPALTSIGLALPLFLVGALAEEVAVRGYVLQNLWEQWGFIPAAMLSAALFAALHLGNPNSHAQLALTLAGLVAYGLWACLSVAWTKSLWLAFGCHFAWNLFEGPVLGFPVSGLRIVPASAIDQQVSGPAWFTGGRFGPEAGLGAIIALGVGLAVLYALHRSGTFDAVPDTREAYAKPLAV